MFVEECCPASQRLWWEIFQNGPDDRSLRKRRADRLSGGLRGSCETLTARPQEQAETETDDHAEKTNDVATSYNAVAGLRSDAHVVLLADIAISDDGP